MHSFKKYAIIPYGEYVKQCQPFKIGQINPVQSTNETHSNHEPNVLIPTLGDNRVNDGESNKEHQATQDAVIQNIIANAGNSKEDPFKLASKVALENFADECDGRVFEEILTKGKTKEPDATPQKVVKHTPKQKSEADTNKLNQNTKNTTDDGNKDSKDAKANSPSTNSQPVDNKDSKGTKADSISIDSQQTPDKEDIAETIADSNSISSSDTEVETKKMRNN